VARRALVHPGLKANCGLFQIGQKLLIGPLFPSFGDGRLDPFPDAKEFAAGLKEQIIVEQAIVQ